LDPRLRGDDAEVGLRGSPRMNKRQTWPFSFHSPLPRCRKAWAGLVGAGGVDCLTEPGIVCFPAAGAHGAQANVPCTQRGSITRPAREFRRSRLRPAPPTRFPPRLQP